MSVQSELERIGVVNDGIPVCLKGPGFTANAVLVLPMKGFPMVTVMKPMGLRIYQVEGDDFIPKGTLVRRQAYDDFEAVMKGKPTTLKVGHAAGMLVAAAQGERRMFIVEFLRLNPEPSDRQVHELASAIGEDVETLEAEIYQMLGQVVASSNDTLVLEDRMDPSNGPTKLVNLNDMGFDPVMIEETQDDLFSDGVLTEG